MCCGAGTVMRCPVSALLTNNGASMRELAGAYRVAWSSRLGFLSVRRQTRGMTMRHATMLILASVIYAANTAIKKVQLRLLIVFNLKNVKRLSEPNVAGNISKMQGVIWTEPTINETACESAFTRSGRPL